MTRKLARPAISLIIVILVFYFAFMLRDLATESELLRGLVLSYGYSGILLISTISGLNIFIPVPAIAFLPLFIEVGLNFISTVLIIGIGMTIGDAVGFVLGKFARKIVTPKESTVSRIQNWRNKNRLIPFLVLFLYASLVPLPNEILVIPLAFIGYKLRHMLLPLLSGNLLFNFLVASGILAIA